MLRKIFGANIRAYSASPDWQSFAEQKKFVYGPHFMAPIRKYTVPQLLLMHQAISLLDVAMRAPQATARYDADYKKYLRDEQDRYANLRKRCPFKESAFLALVAVDRFNQSPELYEKIIEHARVRCAEKAPIGDIEKEIEQFYGRYIKRAENIREMIKNDKDIR